MYDILVDWLDDLEGVEQNPRYHPEGCAQFHSLQVFDHALAATTDRVLLAAALLHDIGKAISGPDHDSVGAEMIRGLPVRPEDGPDLERVAWLVEHHLDLLRSPRETRARWLGTPRRGALEKLRTWDLAGRDPEASVRSVHEAVSILTEQWCLEHAA